MKTDYAILRDGTKLPVSDLYINSDKNYPLRYNRSPLSWTMTGVLDRDKPFGDANIVNIDDVLETLNTPTEYETLKTTNDIATHLDSYSQMLTSPSTEVTPELLLSVADSLTARVQELTQMADELKYKDSPWKPFSMCPNDVPHMVIMDIIGSIDTSMCYVENGVVKFFGAGMAGLTIAQMSSDGYRFMILPDG